MPEVETGRFTIGVFQDVAWAERGLQALAGRGFPRESLSIVVKDSPEAAALVEKIFAEPGRRLALKGIGDVIARGPLLDALDGDARDLARTGIGATMRRVGFQNHDGFIFETLTARGGVLVGVRTEPRAADALALLHAYGGGNAAIGAWTGRV